MNKILSAIFIVGLLAGCAAIKTTPQGSTVRITSTVPGGCQSVGEVIGSQGNWVTGDYTSNSNLMQGARNDARNKAAELGANVVYISNVSNSTSNMNVGTNNTTVVGEAFKCP